MKFIKKDMSHYILGFKIEELDLIGGALKLIRKNMPNTVNTIPTIERARDMEKDIYKILKKDKLFVKPKKDSK